MFGVCHVSDSREYSVLNNLRAMVCDVKKATFLWVSLRVQWSGTRPHTQCRAPLLYEVAAEPPKIVVPFTLLIHPILPHTHVAERSQFACQNGRLEFWTSSCCLFTESSLSSWRFVSSILPAVIKCIYRRALTSSPLQYFYKHCVIYVAGADTISKNVSYVYIFLLKFFRF